MKYTKQIPLPQSLPFQDREAKGFTLVELIVVITILAILGTVAFISFQGFAKDARESARLNDIKTLEKKLVVHKTGGKVLPFPDDSIDIVGSGAVLFGKQGYAGRGVLSSIGQSGEFLDPLLGENYTYYVNNSRSKFQLLGYFEEPSLAYSGPDFITKAYANLNYRDMYPKVLGSSLGVLMDSNNVPIQEVPSIVSVGFIDLTTTTDEFNMYITNELVSTGTGALLTSIVAIMNPEFSKSDQNLNGYFIFDDNEITDFSASEITTSLSGDASLINREGESFMSFPGEREDYLDLGIIPGISGPQDNFSISIWTKVPFDLEGVTDNYNIVGNEQHLVMGFLLRLHGNTVPGNSGTLMLRTNIPGGSRTTTAAGGSYPNDQKWHNLVFVVDGDEGRIYVDGDEVDDYSIRHKPMIGYSVSTRKTAIGADSTTSANQNFIGYLDDFRFYKRTLTENEIKLINLQESKEF